MKIGIREKLSQQKDYINKHRVNVPCSNQKGRKQKGTNGDSLGVRRNGNNYCTTDHAESDNKIT